MIEVISTTTALQRTLEHLPSCGFVPTMGNLHSGHLSLIQQSLRENPVTVVSIFVNPKQFGPSEDFANYPRTVDQDIKLLRSLNADKPLLIFIPENSAEIYPPSFQEKKWNFPQMNILCEKSRPGHFQGVLAVVHLLFSLIKPSQAYFGEKDFQQLFLIKKMVQTEKLPVTIISMPIIRNEDGLALSSRNQYLNQEEKKTALVLPQTLKKIEGLLLNQGLSQALTYANQQVISDLNWDYLEICSIQDLNPSLLSDSEYIILGAYKVGATRLIDNRIIIPS